MIYWIIAEIYVHVLQKEKLIVNFISDIFNPSIKDSE